MKNPVIHLLLRLSTTFLLVLIAGLFFSFSSDSTDNFIVKQAIAQCATPPAPTNIQVEAINNGSRIAVSWNPVSTANFYRLIVDNTNENGWDFDDCNGAVGDICANVSGTSATPSVAGIQQTGEFALWVQAVNSCGQGSALGFNATGNGLYRTYGVGSVPYAFDISGPTTATVGQQRTFTGKFISDFNYVSGSPAPVTGIKVGQNGTVIFSSPTQTIPVDTGNSVYTKSFTWTPTAPGTYDVFLWTDNGDSECWGNDAYATIGEGGNGNYSCEDAGTTGGTLQVTVTGPTPTNTPTPTPTTSPCATSLSGIVTMSVNIPTTSTYRVWSRMMATTSALDSYLLQVDSQPCILVGNNTSIGTSAWSWVDYRDGTTTNKINMTLTAGTHVVRLIGKEANVKVDRILFTDESCTPTGTGDNCSAGTATPTFTPTPTTATSCSTATVLHGCTSLFTGLLRWTPPPNQISCIAGQERDVYWNDTNSGTNTFNVCIVGSTGRVRANAQGTPITCVAGETPYSWNQDPAYPASTNVCVNLSTSQVYMGLATCPSGYASSTWKASYTQYCPVPTPTATPTRTPTPTQLPPTNTPTRTPTPTPPPAKGFSFTLLLHGVGAAGDSVNPYGPGNLNPLTTQRTLNVELYDTSNTLVSQKSGTVTYDTVSGKFAGTVDMGAIASGSYTVKIKTFKYLRKLVPGFITIGSQTTYTIGQVEMIVGDINDDNKLNILDYNILTGCYSDILPAADCDPTRKFASDLDDDGDVNQFDYNLFLRELSIQTGE